MAAGSALGLAEQPPLHPAEYSWGYDYYGEDDADYRYTGGAADYRHYPDYREQDWQPGRYQTKFGQVESEDRSEVRPVYSPAGETAHTADTNGEALASIHVKIFKNHRSESGGELSGAGGEADLRTDGSEQEVAVEFYQPEATTPAIPYVVYSEELNPWTIMEKGVDTKHLYKRGE